MRTKLGLGTALDFGMASHQFQESVSENGEVVGVRCTRCGQIALFQNGRIPAEIEAQKCPEAIRDDVSPTDTGR